MKNPEEHQQRWAEAEKPIQVNEKERAREQKANQARTVEQTGPLLPIPTHTQQSILPSALAWTTAPAS